MSFSSNLCFNCDRPKDDHPLMIFTNGHPTYDGYNRDGLMTFDGSEETRVIMFGQSWKIEVACQEFVGIKQLELF